MRQLAQHFDEPTRRAFLSQAAKTLLGVGALPLLSTMAQAKSGATDVSTTGSAKRVIYL